MDDHTLKLLALIATFLIVGPYVVMKFLQGAKPEGEE